MKLYQIFCWHNYELWFNRKVNYKTVELHSICTKCGKYKNETRKLKVF